MKKTKLEKSKNINKKIRTGRIAITTFILLALTMAFLIAAPLTSKQIASTNSGVTPAPTPANKPLTGTEAGEFVQILNDETENILDDTLDLSGVNATKQRIANAFGNRGTMDGKTARQIADMYLSDSRSVINNPSVIERMTEVFAGLIKDGGGNTGDSTGNTGDSTSTQPSSNTSLRQYIRGLSYDPRKILAADSAGGTLLVDEPDPKKNAEKLRKPGAKSIIRCIKTPHTMKKNFDEIAILQPTQGVVYPGALIFAETQLIEGKPRPVRGLKRSPIDLRLDLPGLEEEGNIRISEPTDGKVQSGINKALNFWNNSTAYKEGYINPSRSSYTATTAYTNEQLAMSLGFNAEWASGEASAQLKVGTSSEKNVFVAVYKQVFYTVTLDGEKTPEQFFDASVTVEDAKDVFNSQTPPAYVSSVSYGRIIMIRMETDNSATKVDAEAAFKYATGANKVGGSLKLEYEKILQNSAFTVVTMGGNAEAAAESVSAKGPEDLLPIIKGKNAVYSKNNPGVPITYTVKFLKDDQVALLGATTDYTKETCETLNNLALKVVHSGAYIAHFTVTWDEPDGQGGFRSQEVKEHGKTVGFQKIFDFPGDAINIRLKMENDTGLVWQPKREIFNRVLLPADLNKCYSIVGTTLGSGYNTDCQL